MFKAAGFAEFIYADLLELVAGLATSDRLWGDFTDEHKSASIVMYMRLLTSAHIRANCESLAGFIHDPESSGSELTVGQFCEMYVEPMGKEADNVQIYALVRALGVDIRIADITEHNTKGEVPFIDPGQEERSSPEADGDDGTLVLLFRPGHYDIIQKTLFE
ncbi:hypothetical protein HYDPIDRAFT_31531 [Hydnomerulius pinastri MD-312]|uniref:Ubiquitinyl hydrolase 1 n=1 Tax=Hydnomerulius pinastri MD-312 TaxID=994086 RepID=A0A0C9W4B5_9AGAM|nr:hypothetical protein HYDPIDRAFT_31531 [Hydnomerulius pinastri MD-312]